MAIQPRTGYFIYQIILTEDQLAELEMLINAGKEDYVAGLLMGRLKSNMKYVASKDSEVKKSEGTGGKE